MAGRTSRSLPGRYTATITPSGLIRAAAGASSTVTTVASPSRATTASTGPSSTTLRSRSIYHVATDDERPYLVCGGLQDNSAWCGPSRSKDPSGILDRHWFDLNGGDGMYAIPAPDDPNLIYNDTENGVFHDLQSRRRAGTRHPAVSARLQRRRRCRFCPTAFTGTPALRFRRSTLRCCMPAGTWSSRAKTAAVPGSPSVLT